MLAAGEILALALGEQATLTQDAQSLPAQPCQQTQQGIATGRESGRLPDTAAQRCQWLEHMQAPADVRQWLGQAQPGVLPEIPRCQLQQLDGGRVAARLKGRAQKLRQRLAVMQAQRAQALIGIALGVEQPVACLLAEWLQRAQYPLRLAGDEDHAMRISDHDVSILVEPRRLQRLYLHLDHGHATSSLRAGDGSAEEVTALTGAGAQPVEAPLAAIDGVLPVGAEAVVLTDEGVGGAPVAGGDGGAGVIDQIEVRDTGQLTHAVQALIECHFRAGVFWVIEKVAQLVILCHQSGQIGVAIQLATQAGGGQAQFVVCFMPQALQTVAAGHRDRLPHAQHQPQR